MDLPAKVPVLAGLFPVSGGVCLVLCRPFPLLKLCQFVSVTANFSSCKQPLLPACLPCHSRFPLVWLPAGSMHCSKETLHTPPLQFHNPLEYGEDSAQAALQICL